MTDKDRISREFWWFEDGRRCQLNDDLHTYQLFIWFGVGILVASHFAISETLRNMAIGLALLIFATVTFMKYQDYRKTATYLEYTTYPPICDNEDCDNEKETHMDICAECYENEVNEDE